MTPSSSPAAVRSVVRSTAALLFASGIYRGAIDRPIKSGPAAGTIRRSLPPLPCRAHICRQGGPAMNNTPQLRPLGETLGTEALGIDLSRPLDEAASAWVRRAFAENPVLVFRDQQLGAQQLADFGRRFGTPRMHALIKYRHA